METFGKEEGRGTAAVEATRRSPSLRRSALLSSSIHPSGYGGVCLSNIEASALSACEAGYIGLLRGSWARHVCAVLAQIVRTRVNLCRRGLLTCPSQSQVCRYVVSLVARHCAGMQPPSLPRLGYLSIYLWLALGFELVFPTAAHIPNRCGRQADTSKRG